jgi:exodeoxyribonuclease V beta subunit
MIWEMERFDVKKVQLEKTNLIEASAGTGKTHSIALLVVRLIVEKGMELPKILMVTFTNAAVAELETRIRSFVRNSYSYVDEVPVDNLEQDLVTILDTAKETNGQEAVKRSLYRSMLFLDETSIFTIHSFCQRTLTEFAFETGQPFESEIAPDVSSYVGEAVKKFWREKITTIDAQLLKLLLDGELSMSWLTAFVADYLTDEPEPLEEEVQVNDMLTAIRDRTAQTEKAWQDIFTYYDDHQELIIQESKSGRQKTSFSAIAEQRENFLDKYKATLKKDSPPQYMDTFLPDLRELFNEYMATEGNLSDSLNEYSAYIAREALSFSRDYIDAQKEKQGILFYDDLILNLHKSLNSAGNEMLIRELNAKYHAVFIDEFHDTDRYQYEIFSSAFIGKCPVFLIGDPKQSIYAFRGADIETYKLAASEADNQYTMEFNFRSAGNYIEAVNAIYSAVEDPFCDKDIGYVDVAPGRDVGKLTHEGKEVIPVTIITDEKKDDAYDKVAVEINRLLTGGYSIEKTGKSVDLKPSDIAVLIRSNYEVPGIKRALTRRGIPAITADDSRVLLSEEAKAVFFILKAILEPRKPNINRALSMELVGKRNDELLGMDDQLEMDRFRQFLDTLNGAGVYGALMQFYATYRLKAHCLGHINGERMISNFLQTAELLQKRQIEMDQTAEQLLTWMQRIFEGESVDGDEYEQRVESDENAVTITTIHRSKGLAYNIVFAPFLNMKAKDLEKDEAGNTLLDQSADEQENRRLMYVALTRAVYKSYINITASSKGSGTIHYFAEGIRSISNTLVEYTDEDEPSPAPYTVQEKDTRSKPLIFDGKVDSSWRILSYSGLSKSHEFHAPEDLAAEISGYDEFIFNSLPKGVVAGHFIHEVFENIDFADDSKWPDTLGRIGRKYGIRADNEMDNYMLMLANILGADYRVDGKSFSLTGLENKDRLNELEFYFRVDKFRTGELRHLLGHLNIDNFTFDGAMHGFVDLFFELNGRYYVLDWKSNYLGNSLSQYTGHGLEQAMTANNYDLQYLIYSVAVKRYLETRIPGFDFEKHFGGVFYVFVRGCREGKSQGLFYTRPAEELIRRLDGIFSVRV